MLKELQKKGFSSFNWLGLKKKGRTIHVIMLEKHYHMNSLKKPATFSLLYFFRNVPPELQ